MRTKHALGILVAVVCLLYLPFLHSAFVSDDIQGIVDVAPTWTWVQALGWPRVVHLSGVFQYWIYHLFGLVPWPFRLLNILAHAGSAVLVYAIVQHLVKRPTVAFVSALVFAIHPIAIESVTWISGGVYALYSVCFLLSLYFFIQPKTVLTQLVSLGAFILSLALSEKAVSLIALFFLYDWFFGAHRIEWKRMILYGVVSLIVIVFYASHLGDRTTSLAASLNQSDTGIRNPFIQIPVAITTYLELFLVPRNLTLYHSELVITWWSFVVRALVTGAAGMLAVYLFLKRKPIGFWMLWFVIALLPTLTPFRIGWIVAERYCYLALVGLSVLFAILFDAVLHRKRLYVPTFIFGLVVLLFFCTQTLSRNAEWVSEDTLWIATARTSPSSPVTWNNMGDVYGRHGDHERAAAMFLRAIAIHPQYADAYHNLASTYVVLNRLDEAVAMYTKALTINPQLWQSHRDLAVIFFNQGDIQRAYEEIKNALTIAPTDPGVQAVLRLISSDRK